MDYQSDLIQHFLRLVSFDSAQLVQGLGWGSSIPNPKPFPLNVIGARTRKQNIQLVGPFYYSFFICNLKGPKKKI